MPRLARVDLGDYVYHIINRAVGRLKIFESKEDYLLFEEALADAKRETDMRILAYVIMPNHWHLVLYPRNAGDLGTFMHRLTNAHTRRVHVRTRTIGHGPLYQGRYKSFIVQNDPHFLTLIKYAERNPVRAKLSKTCEVWRWGSAWRRINGTKEQQTLLGEPPVPLPNRYRLWVNTPEKEDELKTIRLSVNKGVPYGKDRWVNTMVTKYNLESTRRFAGRPKKQS